MVKNTLYILAALTLTACAYDEDTASLPIASPGDGAISFSNAVAPFTRAEKTGKEAADLLGGHFHVYGIKNETDAGAGNVTAENLVFNNYKVTYADGSAQSTTSNSAGWDYVGETLTANEALNISDNAGTGAQLIKYWDYHATDYTFYAFALANNDIDQGRVKVEKVTNYPDDVYRNGYNITVTADANPTQLYLANRLNIKASSNQDPSQSNAYGGKVNFSFRSAMAKVRVGMYETIPGYTLTLNAFRVAEAIPAPSFGDMTAEQTASFAANLANSKSGTAGTINIVYKDQSTGDENAPEVVFNGTKDNVLTLGDNLRQGTVLGADATAVVYDQAGGSYTPVYPMEGNSNNLKLKVDFTLTAKTGETIEVKNATAEVPASYLKWRPGYAYTYIFKISDQTNATIGSLTGLYPITFDALAIVDGTGKEEEISTTGADANHVVTMGYDPSTKLMTVGADDYRAGNTVYATFVGSGAVVSPTTTNARLYIVTTDDADNHPVTESNVADYLTAYDTDATLTDQHVTAYEQPLADADFVSQVPQGDGTDNPRNIAAVSWTASRHVYAVEYTASAGTKHYKVVKVDGYNGLTEGTVTLSPNVLSNTGGAVTPSITVDGVTPSNAEVSYELDYAGTYGAAVPAAVTVTDNKTDGVRINIPANTTASTRYTVIATYNRRSYKATFTVNQ